MYSNRSEHQTHRRHVSWTRYLDSAVSLHARRCEILSETGRNSGTHVEPNFHHPLQKNQIMSNTNYIFMFSSLHYQTPHSFRSWFLTYDAKSSSSSVESLKNATFLTVRSLLQVADVVAVERSCASVESLISISHSQVRDRCISSRCNTVTECTHVINSHQ